MRRPANHHVPVLKQQGWALIFQMRTETDRRAVSVGCRAWNRRLNEYRPPEFLGRSRDVDGVHILDQAATYLRFRHHIERSGGGIDHGSPGDPDLGYQVAAPEIGAAVNRAAPGGNQADLPVDSSIARVNRVQAVVLGGDVKYVVSAACNIYVRKIKRLGVNPSIDGDGK